MKVTTHIFSVFAATLLLACLGWQVQPVHAQTTHVISGNTGVPGATLSYFDGVAATATTDGNGDYSFTVSDGFAGTVTPSKTGYTVVFTPTSIDYASTPVTSDQNNQNYVPDTSWWTVSGNTNIAGVTLSYNDGSPEMVTADGNGDYSLLVPDNFAGMITPSLAGYDFTPASIDYSSMPILGNLPNQDYVATSATFTIAGNAGIAGATLSYVDGGPKTVVSNSDGGYSITIPYNWSGMVTPSKSGSPLTYYIFNPVSKTYTNVTDNQTGQDYIPAEKSAVPIAQFPQGTSFETKPIYQWSRIAAATQYQYQVYKNGVLRYTQNIPASACPYAPCIFDSTKILTDGPHEWQVRAMIDGEWKAFSQLKAFKVFIAPASQQPDKYITDTTPKYIWMKLTSATQYQYQVFRGDTLVYTRTVTAANACNGIFCSDTPTTLLKYTFYKWQIRAFVQGSWRSFSIPKVFIIEEPLINGNFEYLGRGWIQYSTHGWQLITMLLPKGLKPHSGHVLAWLGGDYNEISSIKQRIVISYDTPYLTYWYWIASSDLICGRDTVKILVHISVEDRYDLCSSTNTGGWKRRSLDLSGYTGQSVDLEIRVQTNAKLNSNIFIDDISFQAYPGATGMDENNVISDFDPAMMQDKAGTFSSNLQQPQ